MYKDILLLNSGFTLALRIIYIHNIYLRVVEQKLVISKHLKALLRHLALVFEGLPGLKHFIVTLY